MHLPPRYKFKDWQLLYSTMEHGISLRTFYARVGYHKPTVIVVEDSLKYVCHKFDLFTSSIFYVHVLMSVARKQVFGAFVTGEWSASGKYNGTGESFLFTIAPDFKVPFPSCLATYPHSPSLRPCAHTRTAPQVWEWSRENSFFMCGNPDSIAIGGG